MDNATANLKASHLKVTPQRLAIYTMLLNTKIHPTAEIIYNEIKDKYPSMSLATVYKTLASLKQANLIIELNTDNNSLRYDANTNLHAHLICNKCSNVYDYDINGEFDTIKEKIYNKTGFETENQQIYFYGTCVNCKKNY